MLQIGHVCLSATNPELLTRHLFLIFIFNQLWTNSNQFHGTVVDWPLGRSRVRGFRFIVMSF